LYIFLYLIATHSTASVHTFRRPRWIVKIRTGIVGAAWALPIL
jgi:hypothetical protein